MTTITSSDSLMTSSAKTMTMTRKKIWGDFMEIFWIFRDDWLYLVLFCSPSTGLVQSPAATAPQIQAASTNVVDEVPAGADYPGNWLINHSWPLANTFKRVLFFTCPVLSIIHVTILFFFSMRLKVSNRVKRSQFYNLFGVIWNWY